MRSRGAQAQTLVSIKDYVLHERPVIDAVLSIRDLSVSYRVGTPVIGPLSLDVARGEFVSIVGPSGCGKTTLLNCIGGHLIPTQGMVSIEGVAVDRPMPQIGTVFQKPNLFPWLSVLENVGFGLRMRKTPAAEKRRIATEMLVMVGLA